MAEATKICDMATWPCSNQCLQDVTKQPSNNMPMNVNVSDTTERIPLCKHRHKRQGGWGAAALPTLEKFAKSTIIGQKIGLRSGKSVVNNGSLVRQPP